METNMQARHSTPVDAATGHSPAQQFSREAVQRISADATYLRTLISNVFFIGAPGARDREWTLVDAGLPGLTGRIERLARELYGDSRPNAILLTHAHFDHVGGLPQLASKWQAPVYAHRLETPYLTGRASYPMPDASVGGGLLARLSPLYPRGPIDVGSYFRQLPADGSVPGLPPDTFPSSARAIACSSPAMRWSIRVRRAHWQWRRRGPVSPARRPI